MRKDLGASSPISSLDRAVELAAAPQAEEGTVIVQTDRGPVDVDTSIARIVDALNKAGEPTAASCSGHGFRPGNIALRDGREIIIARNFEEGRMIDRLFPIGASGEICSASDHQGDQP